jgi:hypothetical protein
VTASRVAPTGDHDGVPPNAGEIVKVEWDFEGLGATLDFELQSQSRGPSAEDPYLQLGRHLVPRGPRHLTTPG